MRKRFGNWNDALKLAGIQPTKLMFIPRTAVIEDIQVVAVALDTAALSKSDYVIHGKYSDHVVYRNFQNWEEAVRAAGLTPAYDLQTAITDELCFEAIESVWQRVGRQPKQSDFQKPNSTMAAHTLTRRFGSWRKALEAFVEYVNTPDTTNQPEATSKVAKRQLGSPEVVKTAISARQTPRAPGWKLRFLVMRRDSFRCLQCGRSPAADLGTVLVIDHITPWSKGGATTYENLRTLCEVCNGGRSNLDLE